MAYLLDSSTLIDAKNRYYRFDICPGFWKWLCVANQRGLVKSVRQVLEELMRREDNLSQWCKSRKSIFEDTEDKKTIDSQMILATGISGQYVQAAQAKFFHAADFILVAYAHAHNHTVVTGEVAAYGLEVKIPNACKMMNVPHISTFNMLAREKVQFDLSAHPTTIRHS